VALLDLAQLTESEQFLLFGGRRIHVNFVSGSDSTGDGFSATPYATLARAVQDLVAGDVIVLDQGATNEAPVRIGGKTDFAIITRGGGIGVAAGGRTQINVHQTAVRLAQGVRFTTAAPHGLAVDDYVLLGNIVQTGDVRLNGYGVVAAVPGASTYDVEFCGSHTHRIGTAGNEPYLTNNSTVAGFSVPVPLVFDQCQRALVIGVPFLGFLLTVDQYSGLCISAGRLNPGVSKTIKVLRCSFSNGGMGYVGHPNSGIVFDTGANMRVEGCTFVNQMTSFFQPQTRHLSMLYLERGSEFLVNGNRFLYSSALSEPYLAPGAVRTTFGATLNGPLLGALVTGNQFDSSIPAAQRVQNDSGASILRVFFKQNFYAGATPFAENVQLDNDSGGTFVETLSAGFPNQDAIATEESVVRVATWGEQLTVAAGRPGSIGEFLANLGFTDGSVHIDVANGTAGTAFPIGTQTTPVNNVADALTIATAIGARRYRINGAITLTANHTDWSFEGNEPQQDVITVNPGVNLAGSGFIQCGILGDLSGAISADQCLFGSIGGTLTGLQGVLRECAFRGTVRPAAGGLIRGLVVASQEVGGVILDFQNPGSLTQLLVSDLVGNWMIRNANANVLIGAVQRGGTLVFEGTVLLASVNLYGYGEVVYNPSATFTVLVDRVIRGSSVQLAAGGGGSRRRINVTNPAQWTLEVFAPGNDTTPIATLNLFDQAGASITSTNNPLADPSTVLIADADPV
jgi:hypothetical protein